MMSDLPSVRLWNNDVRHTKCETVEQWCLTYQVWDCGTMMSDIPSVRLCGRLEQWCLIYPVWDIVGDCGTMMSDLPSVRLWNNDVRHTKCETLWETGTMVSDLPSVRHCGRLWNNDVWLTKCQTYEKIVVFPFIAHWINRNIFIDINLPSARHRLRRCSRMGPPWIGRPLLVRTSKDTYMEAMAVPWPVHGIVIWKSEVKI